MSNNHRCSLTHIMTYHTRLRFAIPLLYYFMVNSHYFLTTQSSPDQSQDGILSKIRPALLQKHLLKYFITQDNCGVEFNVYIMSRFKPFYTTCFIKLLAILNSNVERPPTTHCNTIANTCLFHEYSIERTFYSLHDRSELRAL